ncbi:hypothetical protein BMS3Abin06_02464 [bacterium BMS3Abin06]|nr:hypothetical protein BMS3Abin06_02464 [bacterium BMS3Abin06]
MDFIKEIIDESKSYGKLDEGIVSQFLRDKDYSQGNFRFIGLKNGKIVFSVPDQNFAKWYEDPETTIREAKQNNQDPKSKLTVSKREIAIIISQKYGVTFCDYYRQYFMFLKKGVDTFAEAHPKYLSLTTDIRIMGLANLDELFNDLCKFYE